MQTAFKFHRNACSSGAPTRSSKGATRRHLLVSCTSAAPEGAPKKEGVKVTLRMPTGLVFGQNPEGGPVYVDEVVPGGAADKTGKVAKGDVLLRCSAVILKSGKEGQFEKEGYGQRPYDNWERLMFDCADQEFATVMSALKSNNPRWGFNDVVLVFDKP